MGTLDDAIREHLELKRRKGAPDNEIEQKEAEAFGRGPGAPAPPAQPEAAPAEEAPPPPPADLLEDDLVEPDEVLPEESLEPNGTMPPGKSESALRSDELALGETEAAELEEDDSLDRWVDAAEGPAEDLLEETPDFLEETPEHDRLWFEQKPPKDFDFD
jgi:hypothetical protein